MEAILGGEPVVSMRPFSRLTAALLLCTGLPVAGASAQGQGQGQPGWVDPPAKAAAKPLEPATNAAAKPEPSKPETVTSDAAEPPAPSRTAQRHAPSRRALRRPPRAAVVTREPLPAAAPVGDSRLREWAAVSQALARDYLDSVSGPAMLAETPRFYGERVRFHGRTMTLAALTAEKRRFVQRWPERRYEPRPDSWRTACSPALALCRVEAVFDFRAENPARGLRSQGVSSVTFEVSLAGTRPVIVSETSRVLRRDGPVSALGASRRPA